MMYLSKITFSTETAGTSQIREWVTRGEYAIHQWVWRHFTNQTERSFLYSTHFTKTGCDILVLSNDAPLQIAGVNLQTKLFNPKLDSGKHLEFEILVNPTVARPDPDSAPGQRKRGKRCDIMMHIKYQNRQLHGPDLEKAQTDAVLQWFRRQGDKAGFAFKNEDISVHNEGVQDLQAGKRHIHFGVARLKGLLEVTEPEKFVQMLASGIGSQKAFGCGLMLIRPARA